MRELTMNELDLVSGGDAGPVSLSGSNDKRQNGFFTGASLTGFEGGIQNAFNQIASNPNGMARGVSADGQTKPPTTVP